MSPWWSAYACGVRVSGMNVDVDSLQVFVRCDTEDQAKAAALLALTQRRPETGNLKAFAARCPTEENTTISTA